MCAKSGSDGAAQMPPESESPPEPITKDSPVLQPPPVRELDSPADEAQVMQSKARLQSSVLTAMRDYFRDDGREADDFCKRPTTDDGTPMFRVLIIGSGERELSLAKALYECDGVMGVYYTPEVPKVCDVRFADYATSTGTAADDSEGFLRFARWALVDAVFVGPERAGAVPPDVEAELANAAITVFPHDVSAAVADGTLDPAVCLAPLGEDLPGADGMIVGSDYDDDVGSAADDLTSPEGVEDSKTIEVSHEK